MNFKKIDKDKLATTKTIARFVVGKSVAGTVVTIIHQNTETFETSQKVQLFVAGAVLGSLVSYHAKQHIDHCIDEVADAWNSIVDAIHPEETEETPETV